MVVATLCAAILALGLLAACATTAQSSSAQLSQPCGPGRYNTPECKKWQELNLDP